MSKKTYLEFGDDQICIQVPDGAEVLSAGAVTALADPAGAIRRALAEPVGTGPLAELARGRKDAVIVVSDNTRPVPYQGEGGILRPIIQTLRDNGVHSIKVIVANGTHGVMDEAALRRMLDESAWWEGVEIINHVCTDETVLRNIGRTERTADVTVNRHYLDADLKIVTGLVEPHFMAGFSGGRKAICPGICGQNVTYSFHSATIIDDPNTKTLTMAGNPCHEESLRIARMAGVDFAINVTLDNRREITGVFAGELVQAHEASAEFLMTYVNIPVQQRHDIVIIPASYVGMNHYQCAKAGIEAARVVKSGGSIIMPANLTAADAIGNPNYKQILAMHARLGTEEVCRVLLSEEWEFVPEQWEVQMWAKVFELIGV